MKNVQQPDLDFFFWSEPKRLTEAPSQEDLIVIVAGLKGRSSEWRESAGGGTDAGRKDGGGVD